MKNQFIGKNKIFTREQLKEVRGGSDDTYYQGADCGPAGRACRTSADCQDLVCSNCVSLWTGMVDQYGNATHVLRCN